MTATVHIADLTNYRTLQLIELIDANECGLEIQHQAKKEISLRMGQVQKATNEILQQEYSKASRPNWYKLMIIDELERRQAFQAQRKAKAQEREQYQKSKSGTKKPSFYKLLDADYRHSIFKVKWQFKEANQYGLHWKSKTYSRDYADERQKLEGIGDQLLAKMLKEKGEFGYELFDAGGLKEKGFNGFTYSMKTFNSLRNDDKICFFAVYLNNLSDTQINGNDYSMEIWRWGEWK